jgi:hypothetical protein
MATGDKLTEGGQRYALVVYSERAEQWGLQDATVYPFASESAADDWLLARLIACDQVMRDGHRYWLDGGDGQRMSAAEVLDEWRDSLDGGEFAHVWPLAAAGS